MLQQFSLFCFTVLACTSLVVAQSPRAVPVEVQGFAVSASNWVARLDVDLAELARAMQVEEADPAALQVWEVTLGKPESSRKVSEFLFAGDENSTTGTLLWQMDGSTWEGASRRFEIRLGDLGSAGKAVARQGEVRVRRVHDQIIISNEWYEVVHDLKKGGTISQINFPKSGKQLSVQMEDAMHGGGTFELARDQQPKVTVRTAQVDGEQGGLGVIVEIESHFAKEGSDANSAPFARYRYSYFAGSPLVHLEAVLPQQSVQQQFNGLQRFTFRFPEANEFTRTLSILPSGTGPLMVTSLKLPAVTGEHRRLAGGLLTDDTDAVGIISPLSMVSNVDEENNVVIKYATVDGWTGEEAVLSGRLYLGSAAGAAQWIPLAEEPLVEASVPALAQRVALLRAAQNPSTAAKMLLEAAEQRMGLLRSLDEAEELVAAAESLATQKAPATGPELVQTPNFVGMANAQTGLLFKVQPQLASLEGIYRQDHPFLKPAETARPFWMARFRDSQKGWVEVNSSHRAEVKYDIDRPDPQSIRLRLNWPAISAGKGQVTAQVNVVLRKDEPLSSWSLNLKPLSAELGLWETVFPLVAGAGKPRGSTATDFLMVPQWSGTLIVNPGVAGLWNYIYPGNCSWQFLAYWQDRKGLYVATHDPAVAVKEVRYQAAGESGFELRYTNPLPDMGKPGIGLPSPLECVIGTFDGDWYDATQIYRPWLTQQEWFPRKTLHADAQVPQWYKDMCVVSRRNGGPQAIASVKQQHELIGKPEHLLWSYQSEYPGRTDTKTNKFAGVPNVFTPPNFKEQVRELKDDGIRTIGYLLCYWWDYKSENFKNEDAERGVIRLASGELNYYTRREMGIMCPGSPLYQDKTRRIMNDLFDAAPELSGVYFDLGGVSSGWDGSRCFATDHGHPIGSGAWRSTAMRQLLAGMSEVAQSRNPEQIIVTEATADCYLTTARAYMAYAMGVPASVALYGDYRRPAGQKGTEWQDGPLEALTTAKQVAWGVPIGRFYGYEMMDAKGQPVPAKVEYYRRMARYKTAAREWLNYGRMLRPLTVTNIHPAETPELVPGTMVPTGTWQAPDGSVAFVFANGRHSTASRFRYKLDPSAYGIKTDGSMALYQLKAETEPKATFHKVVDVRGTMDREETVAAGDVLILVARPNQN